MTDCLTSDLAFCCHILCRTCDRPAAAYCRERDRMMMMKVLLNSCLRGAAFGNSEIPPNKVKKALHCQISDANGHHESFKL